MKFLGTIIAIVLGSCAVPCRAAPVLHVAHLGLNSEGNREWHVSIAPDTDLFGETPNGFGGRISVELGLEAAGAQLLAAAKNAADWPLDSPGNNPFTGTISFGVSVDQDTETAFAALTSVLLTTGDAVPVLVLETAGPQATTLTWGGQVVLGGTGFEYVGGRIAQAGINFDGIQGGLAVTAVSADFDADSDVDGHDFLLWQRGLGDADSDGETNGVDLAVWKADFGQMAATSSSLAIVPEPAALVLVLIGVTWLLVLDRLAAEGHIFCRLFTKNT